jgi:Protein of unknown function (DUF3025)
MHGTAIIRAMHSAPHFKPLDWAQPWFAPVRAAAEAVATQTDWLSALNSRCRVLTLCNHRDLPLSFANQSALPEGAAYEAFISERGCVPTRDNLHDFLNALVWLSFPRIKAQLNALQAAQIARSGIGASRGSTRDAVTLFDENAAILAVRDSAEGQALVAALRSHQWQRAFIDLRSAFGEHAEVWLFGHALMEKLVTPYKGITAHTWVLTLPEEFFGLALSARREWIDQAMADALTRREPDSLTTACFTPLPVLGVPCWWPGQDAAFYADATVFRPRPRGRQ